ncbi:hypothetical protein M422DRAFT_238407 [Sphaerobolus stellatus SS14]|nr:hypothetical protein M422DRAFT_238407 [Sphaerobolus stellatus SS14]
MPSETLEEYLGLRNLGCHQDLNASKARKNTENFNLGITSSGTPSTIKPSLLPENNLKEFYQVSAEVQSRAQEISISSKLRTFSPTKGSLKNNLKEFQKIPPSASAASMPSSRDGSQRPGKSNVRVEMMMDPDRRSNYCWIFCVIASSQMVG